MNFSEIMYCIGMFIFVFSLTSLILLSRQKNINNTNIIDAILYSTIAILMMIYIKK